jgi:hypothetical protein
MNVAPKTGFVSSEFWQTAPAAAALFQIAGTLPEKIENPVAQTIVVSICTIGGVFLVAWYTMKRTDLKKGGTT